MMGPARDGVNICPNNLVDATRWFRRAFLLHHLHAAGTLTETAKRLGTQRTYIARLNRTLGIEGPRSSNRTIRAAQGQR